MTLEELLKQYNFKSIYDFRPRRQKQLYHSLGLEEGERTDFDIYAKVLIITSDTTDECGAPLWKTTSTYASFVLVDKEGLFDKFVVPVHSYYIRTKNEFTHINDNVDKLISELDDFDQFINEEPCVYA